MGSSAKRKGFTTPLLTEAESDRNTKQFTKKKSRCQSGGVRGAANQHATTERTNLQTKSCSKDEAAALRKNHVVRRNGLRDGVPFFEPFLVFNATDVTSVCPVEAEGA